MVRLNVMPSALAPPTEGIFFVDFVAKRRTNKRSDYIISDQQSIADRLSLNSTKFINK